MYFKYGSIEINYLKKRDSILGEAIEKIGHINREVFINPLAAIIRQIIAQQISKEAALTVTNRFSDLIEKYDIVELNKLDIDSIKQCGMSYRKAEYIKSFIDSVFNKEIDLDNLDNLSNEKVIVELTRLKGIGLWSAQMFLLFTLQRKDIIAYDDLAIRNGIIKLYKLDSLSKNDFLEYKKRYGDYASIASLYLWHIAHNDY